MFTKRADNGGLLYWQYAVLLFVILSAGILLRCYFPYFRSMWGDEAHSFYKAYWLRGNISLQSIIPFTAETIKQSHMPLYFVLLSVWMEIFGPAEIWLRMLSMLFGCLSLACFYFFAREITDKKTALIGTLILSLSPMAVMFSQEIRMYSLALLLSILSSWAFVRCIFKGASALRLISYFFITALFCLTHVYALLAVICQGVYLLYRRFAEKQSADPFAAIITVQILLALLIFPLYYSMLTYNLRLMAATDFDLPYRVFPAPLRILLFIFALCLGETVAPWNLLVVIPAGLVFGYLILKGSARAKGSTTVYLALSLFVPLTIAGLLLKGTMPKYLIVILPFFILFISRPLAEMKKGALALLLLAVVAVQSASLYNYFTLKEYHNSNQIEPWRQVSEIIKDKYKKDDAIVYTNRGIIFQVLNYYLNLASAGDYRDKKTAAPYYNMTGTGDFDPNDGSYRRVWYISHIADDRNIREEPGKDLIKRLEKKYKLVIKEDFVPYSATLVSQLPIKRHAEGSSRIEMRLFEKKGNMIKSPKKN